MGLRDNINNDDVKHLHSIRKKLNLKMSKLAQAKSLQANTSLTEDEKIRIFLDIPEDTDTRDFLERELSSEEIETIQKFVKF